MTINLNLATRSCYCGQARPEHIGQTLILKGWAHYRRDHGGLIFVDLRDREGLVQVVFDPDILPAEQFEIAHKLKAEDVLAIEGAARPRPEGTINPNLATGEIEVLVQRFEVLAHSKTLPFAVDEHTHVNEDLRLRFRYLDLRRPVMQANIRARAQLARIIRAYMDAQGLIEIETPMLTKSTPEGARDFLVPSRINEGAFYALPQSPQLFKQILMIAGFDGYYQIVHCFRDEDLRANRQPEFTQLDVEQAFITPEDIYRLIEGLMVAILKEMKSIDVSTPFARLTYEESMLRFGTDKPDLRFDIELHDVGPVFSAGCDFKVFNSVLEKGGVARALCIPGGGEKFSNTQLKPGGELTAYAARHGAKGLAWFRVETQEGKTVLNSSISKFFDPECQQRLIDQTGAQPGDLILIICDQPMRAATALGQMRLLMARKLDLIDASQMKFCWITDFPLVEWDREAKRWSSLHHPFTSPNPEDLDLLESDPGKVRSLAYDLSLNGEEIGGGSIRIHRADMQSRIFQLLGIGEDEAKLKFGFLLEALSYGAPPHGGIAFGFDRILMILQGTDSIRDVIAFPKTQSATCLMTEAPSAVDDAQLKELGIRLDPSVEKRLKEKKQSEAAGVKNNPDILEGSPQA